MKSTLRKTELRKTILFMVFTGLTLYMLSLDAKVGQQGATVAAAVEILGD